MRALIVIYYLIASSLGLILVKQALSGTSGLLQMKNLVDMRLLGGAALYLTSFLAWFYLLSKNDLTYIYPIVVGLGYVVILLFSIFILGEQPNLFRYAGIVLILLGVMLIIIKGKGN